jgi:sulfite reductase (NADPH) flavoprotein alpha-component
MQPQAQETKPSGSFTKQSSSLPFGQAVPLSSISGPTYVTTQLLVQQIAYKLSDKVYSYSPETFDLDVAARAWAANGDSNIHGYQTSVLPLQARSGAGALALGYVFSPDFDVAKRHIPQTLIASSGNLQQLRGTLDQLSLLYGVSSPFAAHIASTDYSSSHGLVSNFDTAMRLAEDLGLGLVSSSSTYEAQHMSIFATLLASIIPTIHTYDGIRVARETLRIVDALSETGVAELYNKLSSEVSQLNKRLDSAGKTLELLRLFNDELGTIYQPFEYHGHETPDVVLVTFGSVESQVANQVISRIAADGAKVGAINVRIYRPFIEEAFIKAVPASARTIAVFGQVKDEAAVTDEAAQSALYGDVLTAVSFGALEREPEVLDIKYTPYQTLTPQGLTNTLHKIFGNEGEAKELPSLISAKQYTFWDLDTSVTLNSPSVIGSALSKDSSINVYVHETYDNLVQGGVIRTDVRASKKALLAPYDVTQADVVLVGDEKLLKEVDVVKSVAQGGKVILKLANFKADEIEKRLPVAFRKALQEKGAELFAVDVAYSPAFEKDLAYTKLLLEFAFLKVSQPDLSTQEVGKLVALEESLPTLEQCIDAVSLCLHSVEVPASWAEVEADYKETSLPITIQPNSFVPAEKDEVEQESEIGDWQAAAKGLAFKEAYGTKTTLRPDLSVKTATITVKENRRLTPATYDRNIFHIEFDLGDSGLTYKIGEALGVHAENDTELVNEFIESYGLNPAALVQVPSREDNAVTEVRTIYQALVQNVDILGKPAKRFYEALAEFATDDEEKKLLEKLASQGGAEEFKKRSEVDTVTYIDILQEFTSARPSFSELVKIVSPLKRREYSIASAQAVTPNSVSLMIVVVDWVDPKGRTRWGHASRWLSQLQIGATVTASVKPSVMKLPARDDAPLIMAGLGTGLAPFRAFCQYRAMQKAQGVKIGPILLYLGSRHQREEYLYGEEWEAYLAAGVITLVGAAFSRDQPQKIYIQDRMRQTLDQIVEAYVKQQGTFYLCGPTWPVPDVSAVMMEAIAADAKDKGKKVDPKKELEKLKEEGRYVLEVY